MTDDTPGADDRPKITGDYVELTIETDDGTDRTISFDGPVTFMPEVDARKAARQLREDAPHPEHLARRVTDIDSLIDYLEAAKEHGVERVYVNDDGQTRGASPTITNNHVERSALGPEPGDLVECLEL